MAGATDTSVILKRIAALNRGGALTKPLQYSQVRAELGSISEEAALRILNQLEVEAATATDPVEYVKEKVGQAAVRDPPSTSLVAAARKRKAGSNNVTAPAGGRDVPGAEGMVAKKIRLLNGSGALCQSIELDKVNAALGSLGIGQAMTILKGLEDSAAEVRNPTTYIRMAVKSAGGTVPEDEQVARLMRVKQEAGLAAAEGRDFRGAKTEELTESERVERHLGWMNRTHFVERPIDIQEVLPSLDCIGYRQSMRVLKRLEENKAAAPEPNEYIKDQVARCGWIFGKPDIVDEDERVGKRVAWMNQFAMLKRPIDYAQVADSLDGLKVAHAMVLLRELEVQAHSVEDPTDYIRKAISLAGEDEVPIALEDPNSSIAQHIASLNASGTLAKPIEYGDVGSDLARIGDSEALLLLQEIARKGTTVKDPTGFLKFKLKAKLAALGGDVNASEDAETKILKRVEWLNDYGGLLQDVDYHRVSAALETAGLDQAMTILTELEDKRGSIRDPTAFILNAVKTSWRRKAAQPDAGRPKGPALSGTIAAPLGRSSAASARARGGRGVSDLEALSSFMDFLRSNPRVKADVSLKEVASALEGLPAGRAIQVLQQMQEKGLGLDDPVTYIKAVANRGGVKKEEGEEEEGDDVAKITARLKWLNQFGALSKKIRIRDVIGALYCLGVPQSMEILRSLQEKGSLVSDPTWFIKAGVQRANGVKVTPKPAAGADDAEAEEYDEEDFADEAAEAAPGFAEFPEPEGDEDGQQEDFGGDDFVDFDMGEWAQDPAEMELDEPAAKKGQQTKPELTRTKVEAKAVKNPNAPKRVVGGLHGATGKLVPTRRSYLDNSLNVKGERMDDNDIEQGGAPGPSKLAEMQAKRKVNLLPTPQEKLVQVRDLAVKHGLHLDEDCLKNLARLQYSKAKDLIDEVLLGGRDRRGVNNPSRYLNISCQKAITCLGVEQGLAMELAVTLGCVLSNDALDELASIPRKESHAIIHELADNDEYREDPLEFIKTEVLKCRADMDARPWPSAF